MGLFTFCPGEKWSVEDLFVGLLPDPPVIFYIGHTGTPTKAKLNARADKCHF